MYIFVNVISQIKYVMTYLVCIHHILLKLPNAALKHNSLLLPICSAKSDFFHLLFLIKQLNNQLMSNISWQWLKLKIC